MWIIQNAAVEKTRAKIIFDMLFFKLKIYISLKIHKIPTFFNGIHYSRKIYIIQSLYHCGNSRFFDKYSIVLMAYCESLLLYYYLSSPTVIETIKTKKYSFYVKIILTTTLDCSIISGFLQLCLIGYVLNLLHIQRETNSTYYTE